MKAEILLSFYARLANRKQEVLELASMGLSNAEIADMLCIETSVVAEHLTYIYECFYNVDGYGFISRPNRRIIIRYFTLFFVRYPGLQQYTDEKTLMI